MKRKRAEWRAWQPGLDPGKLVFVDETWASTNMARTHGRCPRGERLQGEAGVSASVGTIWTFLDRAGLTFKKRPLMPKSRSDRTS